MVQINIKKVSKNDEKGTDTLSHYEYQFLSLDTSSSN